MKSFGKYLLFAIVAVAVSCDEETSVLMPERDPHYFPLQKGRYQIYDIHQITYSVSDDPDTSDFELKTEVVDSFPNPTGGYNYIIDRSVRVSSDGEWVSSGTWTARVEENEIVVNEENVQYLKFLWPARQGTRWDGNKFNTSVEDEYVLVSLDEPFAVNDLSFDETITILQEDNDDPVVFTDLRSEVYARGVGLISKDVTQLEFCVEQSCNNQNVIIGGVKLTQRIKAYGIN